MPITFSENVVLEKLVCGGCGIVFAMPADMIENKRKEAGSFYCPNGCHRGWSESDADRLRKQLEAKERELRESKCETLRERTLREMAVQEKAKVERKVDRVQKGVCPCCRRFFTNLSRHMATKHPAAKTAKPNKTHEKTNTHDSQKEREACFHAR